MASSNKNNFKQSIPNLPPELKELSNVKLPSMPGIPNMPDISKIEKEKEKLIKSLEKLNKSILKKFEKYIIGVALLPPKKLIAPLMPQLQNSPNPSNKKEKEVNVLVLVNDQAFPANTPKQTTADKMDLVIKEIAKKIDDNLRPEVLLISELKEDLFDGKYQILTMIAMSTIVYDKGMLGALKVSEIHKSMVLKRFDKYIVSYVAAGSLFRGDADPHDIDIYIVIDDTDVKRMPRLELKEKLRAIITSMGFQASAEAGIADAKFHVQTYILTDFWDLLKDANPVIFTFLRDGVPLYDRGVFMPWKILLQMGRIKPSPEAIDMNMDVGARLIDRVKQKLLSVIGEDLFWAALNPSQAALMLYGLAPPTPKETVKLLNDVFVKKEKLLEKKYVDVLERVRKAYKDLEHGKLKEISGKDIDKIISDVEDYLKRLDKLFDEIERRNKIKSIEDIHFDCISAAKDAIRIVGAKPGSDVVKDFKKCLIDCEKLPKSTNETLKRIIKAEKDFNQGKLTKQEIEKVAREARVFIKNVADFVESKKAVELERARIRFKHGEIFGEAILLDKVAFIIPDLEKIDEINKGEITKSGGIKNMKKSSVEEFEKYIAKMKMPKDVFIKEKIFEDLKKIFGQVEIMISS